MHFSTTHYPIDHGYRNNSISSPSGVSIKSCCKLKAHHQSLDIFSSTTSHLLSSSCFFYGNFLYWLCLRSVPWLKCLNFIVWLPCCWLFIPSPVPVTWTKGAMRPRGRWRSKRCQYCNRCAMSLVIATNCLRCLLWLLPHPQLRTTLLVIIQRLRLLILLLRLTCPLPLPQLLLRTLQPLQFLQLLLLTWPHLLLLLLTWTLQQLLLLTWPLQ